MNMFTLSVITPNFLWTAWSPEAQQFMKAQWVYNHSWGEAQKGNNDQLSNEELKV